ncbi:hypothetical protein FOA52_013701, partial [Chlamydomonas sp. UWO 241]
AGVRCATILIYLNEPDDGGETAFPNSEWVDKSLGEQHNWSECAAGHVAFKPKRGDALLFWSIGPDGNTEDFHASHTGCPVLGGVKWTLTKWVHVKPFRPHEIDAALRRKAQGYPQLPFEDPGTCRDNGGAGVCKSRAEKGECESDKDSMVVGAWGPGACRLTCKSCRMCGPDDIECYDENRRNIGYLNHNASELRPLD